MREDTELMSEFVSGDENAFDELVQRHQSRVLNFLYRMTWDRTTSEDLTQEVFTKQDVWNKIIEGAHKVGEPGVAFMDTINKENPY